MIEKNLLERIEEKKRKLSAIRPLDKHQVMLLKREMEIEYVYNSTNIEGNSLTLDETRLVIEEGMTIKGKPLREHFDVINQKDAMDRIEILAKKKMMKEADILELHRITMKGISNYWAGKYKTSPNRVLGSKVKRTSPYKVREEMNVLIKMINRNPEKLNIIELAAIAHQIFVKIHPFIDGNGRTARLLSNLILIKNNYPPNTILNKERKKYFDNLERAHLGNKKPFVDFFARGVERMLDLYLNALLPSTRENELLSLSELSKETLYSQEYLSLLARRNKLSTVKIDGIWYSSRERIKKYMDSLRKK
ncbi:MAG: Fic family protein [Candidatus Aenigmarchaeota archaeon]|nr:Fic family protein [Candidatus Aenigmarchaeota archaeon]